MLNLLLLVSQLKTSWNVMAHAQKPDFVFLRNGRVHLNRRGRQFSRLLAVEVCASAVLMLDTSCSEVVWRVLATHSIRLFPLHFPSFASPCVITFQLDSTSLHILTDTRQTPQTIAVSSDALSVLRSSKKVKRNEIGTFLKRAPSFPFF